MGCGCSKRTATTNATRTALAASAPRPGDRRIGPNTWNGPQRVAPSTDLSASDAPPSDTA